jgi:hypothetical protein
MNLDLSKISVSRVILWLIAIAIVSFFMGFVTLAMTGGFSPPNERWLANPEKNTSSESTYGFLTPDGAQSADVFISMGAGDLTVQGGADEKNLMESTISTSNPAWRPAIDYSINNSHGNLRITQKDHAEKMMFPGTLLNRWDIRFNDEIPLSLDVNTGVGDSKLNIGTLNLTALHVKMGTGDQIVDFSGYSRDGLDTEITCGVGDLTVRVPRGMNSRITVDNGIGDISADGFVKKDGVYRVSGSPYTVTSTTNIHVKQGVGSITLEAV